MEDHPTHPQRRRSLALPITLLIGTLGLFLYLSSAWGSPPDGNIFLPIVTSNQSGSSPSATPTPLPDSTPTASPTPVPGPVPIVFVSRQIPPKGSVYLASSGDMPGVGPYSRFRIAAPGKLLVRETNGSTRTLIDGSSPSPQSMNLIDVNAPDVSYDGTKIVFAGLAADVFDPDPDPLNNPHGWRLYVINVDGTGLRQLTFPDQDDLDLSQFENLAIQFRKYDDTDPVWLPDGRIAFASTRWPAIGQYSGARTSNLYVINADGSGLHRITAERNGGERPMVDPITGKIVYARWWRNHRHASNSMATIEDPGGGYVQKDGLTRRRDDAVGGSKNTKRNAWHLATINPDGTDLAMWTGVSSTFGPGEETNHAYGGAFTPDGRLYANHFPMENMTEAAGFGGIRLYERGPGPYEPIIGVTTTGNLAVENPPSYGVYEGPYAGEPEVLPDGRLVISWAADTDQDYGLYLINPDGSGLTLLYDNPGTTELRARAIRPRPRPPIIPDTVTGVASLLPPLAEGPYDIDGTFTFNDLNVYFNAPVDVDIVSAPPVGSAGSIRFYIDHQRLNPGSFPQYDWPILLDELPISPAGSVVNPNAPANVQLFEQIRAPQPAYTVPLTGRGFPTNGPNHVGGAAHVAGLNFGRPGAEATCVGCHSGHTLIPVPDNPADAQWTNLAPGAEIEVSSVHPVVNNDNLGLIDRRVTLGVPTDYWRSDPASSQNGQWVELIFPVPVDVRTVRLYNPPPGGAASSSLKVRRATVRLFSDAAGTVEVANRTVTSPLSPTGTDVAFGGETVRVVRVELDEVTGTFYNQDVASLAEIEVIARGSGTP